MEVEVGMRADARARARHRHRQLTHSSIPRSRPRSGPGSSAALRLRPRSGRGVCAASSSARARLCRRCSVEPFELAVEARDVVRSCSSISPRRARPWRARPSRPSPASVRFVWCELSRLLSRRSFSSAQSLFAESGGSRRASRCAVGQGRQGRAGVEGEGFGGGAGERVGEPVDGPVGLGAVRWRVGLELGRGRVEAGLLAGAARGRRSPTP